MYTNLYKAIINKKIRLSRGFSEHLRITSKKRILMVERIEILIAKYCSDSLSDTEVQELIAWIKSGKNKKYFNEYLDLNFTLEQFKSEKQDDSALWELIKSSFKTSKRTLNYWKYAVAASVALIISSVVLFDNAQTTTPIIVNNIKIGTDKAILSLENGVDIILGKNKNYKTNNLSSNGKELVYGKAGSTSSKIAYNYLTIPRGGQFYLKLEDGTQVWLNSESKIKYPKAFISGIPREVELIYGEAYFDVSSSAEHGGSKFKVRTGIQEIEVLGTEFNIKAYNDDDTIYTTLVEGTVVVSNGESKEVLQPNQQAAINIQNKDMSIGFVDVYNMTSWKNGIFSFKNKPLKEIMKTLSRWYDIEITFENKELEAIKFNGVLNKKQNIEHILLTIKTTNNIIYEIDDNKIIIK